MEFLKNTFKFQMDQATWKKFYCPSFPLEKKTTKTETAI